MISDEEIEIMRQRYLGEAQAKYINVREEDVLLFHGSKAIFDKFDPAYARTGEGMNHTTNWNFIDNLKGAYYHAESILKNKTGNGLIYVCCIHGSKIIFDCEYGNTDKFYNGQTCCVEYEDSKCIEIIEILNISGLHEEVDSTRKYYLATAKAPLKGG